MQATAITVQQGVETCDKAKFAAKAITEWECVVLLTHNDRADRFVCRHDTADKVDVEHQLGDGQPKHYNLESALFISWISAMLLQQGYRWANYDC